MEAIARASGVSRQTLYLHFNTRTDLLAALVRHVDVVHDFAGMLRKCESAPGGSSALWAFIGAWGSYVARITDIARAMRAAGAHDEDAASAYRERMRAFTRVCARFVTRLKAEGSMRQDCETALDGADFLATLLSIENWQHLVEERGWSRQRYVSAMRWCVQQTLLNPSAPWEAHLVKSRRR